MPSVRKTRLAFKIIGKDEAMAAMEIYAYVLKRGAYRPDQIAYERLHGLAERDHENEMRIAEFSRGYHHSYEDTIAEIWKWQTWIIPAKRDYPLNEVFDNYIKCVGQFDKEPKRVFLK